MITLTEAETEAIYDAVDRAGMDWGENVRRNDYSGRGMFGDECFGIVTTTHVFGFFVELPGALERAGADPEVARDLANNLRFDGMGRATIYYFPNYVLGVYNPSEDYHPLNEAEW